MRSSRKLGPSKSQAMSGNRVKPWAEGMCRGTPWPKDRRCCPWMSPQPAPQGNQALRPPSCPRLSVRCDGVKPEVHVGKSSPCLGDKTRMGVGTLASGRGTRPSPPPPLLSCVWLKSLCFFFSQLGFSHPRPSSNYRWDSPDWCERVFCQVSKIRLHHHPPRWHVSSFVGLHLLRTEGADRETDGAVGWEPHGSPSWTWGRPTRPDF